MPKVSAVVSSYKSDPQMLNERLSNLFSQSLQDMEVILVVNDKSRHLMGAEDSDTADVLINWSDEPRLKFISTRREGIYASWNRAIREARGEYITNANVDDRLLFNGLATLANALDERPDVGLVYGDSYVVTRIPETGDGVNDFELCRALPYPDGMLGLRDYDPDELSAHHSIGNCPMWRRSLHDQFGYFDESMQLAADYEWALRLQSGGVSFYYVKDSVATFYFGKNSTTLHQSQSDYEARLARLRWARGTNGSARPDHAGRIQADAGP